MNATLISNGINRRFSDISILRGVLRSLMATGRAMQLPDYAIEKKDGEVDTGKIGGLF